MKRIAAYSKSTEAIFEYFDHHLSGRLDGNAQTEVDRNTYEFFEMQRNGVPTYAYKEVATKTAVNGDKVLVPYHMTDFSSFLNRALPMMSFRLRTKLATRTILRL